MLDQLMMGKTNAEIGSTLFICEKAVKFHMTNIMRKYGVTNRTSLIVKETQRRIEKGNS